MTIYDRLTQVIMDLAIENPDLVKVVNELKDIQNELLAKDYKVKDSLVKLFQYIDKEV